MSDIRRRRQAKKQQSENRSSHPLAWLRPFVGPGFIVGGWGVISNSYIVGVCAIYFGLAILFLEVSLEPWIVQRASLPVHLGLIALCLFFIDLFTIGFVATPAPINFATLQTEIDYTAGNAPAGIQWEPFFSELDFIVTNLSNGNYDNVDLLVRPDLPVAKIAQQSSLQGVSFEDRYGLNLRATVEEVGLRPPVPVILLATNAGYKVHCPSIPPNASLNLVMAIVEFKKPATAVGPLTIPSGADLSQLVMTPTITNAEGTFASWFGTAVNKLHYIPKPTVKKVHVEISYTASYRKRNKTLDVSVDPWKRQ